MINSIISENRKKVKNYSLIQLIFFAMFCFWQMGFIYFIGPSLTIDGKTPLPISTDNIAILIMGAYVVSILIMIFLPFKVITSCRVCTVTALITLLGLFFPLDADILRLLIYIHEFVCCVMIGFESFIMVNFFSENCTIKHLTLAYGVALAMISFVQNDFMPISFSLFRNIIVVCLVLLFIFYMKLPTNKDALPRYVKKSDNFTPPKKLMTGAYILMFVSALMAVSGPSIAGEVRHGVFIMYIADAVASFLVYALYKKLSVHPFFSISFCIALGSLGFLSMYISAQFPGIKELACVLIGIGMLPCQMIPLYCVMIKKTYPSKFLAPVAIVLALVAVFIQSSMVSFFREIPAMLNLAYCVIMIILVLIYMNLEPFFLYSFRRKVDELPEAAADAVIIAAEEGSGEEITAEAVISETESANITDSAIASLTKRELEVLDLIGCGFSNAEIAKALFISEHTVNDYTKKIYRKLNVHSRHAAAQYINKRNNA